LLNMVFPLSSSGKFYVSLVLAFPTGGRWQCTKHWRMRSNEFVKALPPSPLGRRGWQDCQSPDGCGSSWGLWPSAMEQPNNNIMSNFYYNTSAFFRWTSETQTWASSVMTLLSLRHATFPDREGLSSVSPTLRKPIGLLQKLLNLPNFLF
jgi:hypothetical protein